MKNRVVITGIGIVSPIGNKIEDFTSSLKSGVNGVKKITLFDTTNHSVHIAAECSIDLDNFFDKKELNRLDRFAAFSLIASEQAIKQANLLNSNNLDIVLFPHSHPYDAIDFSISSLDSSILLQPIL